MVKGLRKQQTVLIICLRTDDNYFYFGSFLMGDTYYILKELQIESFGGRNVFHIVHFADFTNDSVQWYIVSLIRFSICIAKHEPATIILFKVLRMEC
jgi:hypothetical protein